MSYAMMTSQRERVDDLRECVVRTALILFHVFHRVHELKVPHRVVLVAAHENLRDEERNYLIRGMKKVTERV